MPREVIINGSTFLVNSYSAEGATETLDELLKRVIVSNAEREFKKRPRFEDYGGCEPAISHEE